MGIIAQRCVATALVLALGAGASGCAAQNQSTVDNRSSLTSCDEIIPAQVAEDIIGSGGHLVPVEAKETDSVSPIVDRMVTDGIACGGSVNGAEILDGAVMIGQLETSKEQWDSIQTEFAADGHVASDDFGIAGWVYVSKPSDVPGAGSGFAWRDGVLYYLINPMMLAFVPAFASEFADASRVFAH